MTKRRVIYQGVEMVEGWPQRIQEAQTIQTFSIGGVEHTRIRYGDEADDWGADRVPCHDCAVLNGEDQVTGCRLERRPSCCRPRVRWVCCYAEDAY